MSGPACVASGDRRSGDVDRRRIGATAEAAAARALGERGYVIVARNVRLRGGEIDLVCRHRETFVFCEVKARRPSSFGVAVESLTREKRRRLERLAETYLARVGRRDAPFRLELVAVELAGGEPEAVRLVPFG